MKLRTTFSRKRLLAMLLALSAIVAGIGAPAARPLRHAGAFFLAPLGDAPMYAVTQLSARIAAAGRARMSEEEARKLREENQYLRRLAAYWQYQEQVYRQRAEDLSNFQRMYGPARDLACELIAARVVAAGSLPYGQTRLTSPGEARGIRSGSPVTTRQLSTRRSKALPPKLAVVDSTFLVGRIADSGAFTARLQLLSDRGFRIQARVLRQISPTRPRMVTVTQGSQPRTTLLTPENNYPIEVIAKGDGGRHVLVEHVKEYHKVRRGDLLLTSTRAADMPAQIHVGKVVEVQRGRDPRRVTLKVAPHADLANIRNVYIISPVRPPAGTP